MLEIKGKYNEAKVYTDMIEEGAVNQIKELCNQEFSKDCKIRIMPDVHCGASCVIGFTANLGERVIPNIVGVDIGCGMLTVELGNININVEELDSIINKYVPSGKNVHNERLLKFSKLQELNCYRALKQTKRIERSIGTLGGGNHFIEVDIDDENNKYLIIHTGSRNLGKQVAEHYQKMAIDIIKGKDGIFEKRDKIIKEYKEQGRKQEIQNAIKELISSFEAKEINTPEQLCYLTGKYRDLYLNDMKICQQYATLNRIKIAEIILQKLLNKNLQDFSYFETVHNYIDYENNIVRKGAVSAKKDEKFLIPINMCDGSLICIGKGNEDWNFSAPHGAGRLYSRTLAKKNFTLDEFKQSMKGIFTNSVNEFTLDESPMAYKGVDNILNNIEPTAEIFKIIKPIYNFKANN